MSGRPGTTQRDTEKSRRESACDTLDKLRAIRHATRQVLSAKSIESAMYQIIRSAASAERARSGLVVLIDEAGRLGLHFAVEAAGGYVDSVRSGDHSPLHQAMVQQEAIAVENTQTEERFPHIANTWRDHAIHALLAAPLISADGKTLGALELHFDEPRALDDEHVESIGIHADLAVSAILRADEEAKSTKSALARAALEDTIRRQQEINAIVCHDLRNPLFSILTSASLLQRTTDSLAQGTTHERHRKQIEHIQRSGRRMARLIEDLLDLGQIETGRLRMDVAMQSVADILNEAIEGIQDKAAKKSITVTVDVDPVDASFACDRERLLQVLGNFLTNAVKFTPDNGWVRATAAVKGWRVVFAIQDTGVGISPESLPHIFEPYWQAKPIPHEGVGLGLAIAKNIVEAHGGCVRVESAVGKGTTMSFDVPAGPKPDIATEIATFLGIDRTTAQTYLERARQDSAWDPGPEPGIGLMPITAGPEFPGAKAFLVRIASGVTYPHHEHVGDEHVFVFQAGLRDNDGVEVWEGQRGYRAHGTSHSSLAIGRGDCLLAAMVMPRLNHPG